MFTSNPSKNSTTASHLRHLEDAVSKHVRVWIATLAEQWLRQRLAGRGAESQEASTACDTVGWLLREAWRRGVALVGINLRFAANVT